MNRKKKVKPRKPVIRRVASKKVEVPQVEISVSNEQRQRRILADYYAGFSARPPTFWQSVCSWCRDNPMDAWMGVVGLGIALVLGVMAAL